MTETVIEANKVSFGYRYDKLALTNIQFAIPKGARVAFIGPNGAGKSTLFLHFNAILKPTQGYLSYNGQPYSYSKSSIASLRQKVGLVFQDQDSQLFAGNVLDDVVFGPANMGITMVEAENRARRALAAVQMDEFVNEPVHFLSPGQKKRVAIAGVLAMDPEVLVMDEPTAGLDFAGITNFNDIMDGLHRQGKTLVVATHDMDWVWAWADIVYVINQGRVAACGSAEQVLSREDHAELGFARPVIGEIYQALRRHKADGRTQPPAPKSVGALLEILMNTGNHGGKR